MAEHPTILDIAMIHLAGQAINAAAKPPRKGENIPITAAVKPPEKTMDTSGSTRRLLKGHTRETERK